MTISKHNILIIEDSPTIQHLLKIHISLYDPIINIDIDLKFFTHIDSVIDFLKNTTESIHLIICDIMLPGEYSGLDFLHYIRKDHRFCSIPFVIITANTDKTIKRKSYELQCNGYIYKPFTITQIHEVLNQWLKIEY